MQAERKQHLAEFIASYFTSNYSLEALLGDASSRNYYRLRVNPRANPGARDNSYIVMDCPKSAGDLAAFIQIDELLRQHGFAAPKIMQADLQKGFLILEDFGQLSLKDHYKILPALDQLELYQEVITLLAQLQKITPPANLKHNNNELLITELEPFFQYFIPYQSAKQNKAPLPKAEIEILRQLLTKTISSHQFIGSVFTLRDFHAENIMYLAKNSAIKKYGLLDFQDALISYQLYDVVSLLQDARIKLAPEFAMKILRYYTKQTGLSFARALADFQLLGLQRNLRILGIFAKKSQQEQNNRYLPYILIVLDYVKYNLTHPLQQELKNCFERTGLIFK